MSNNNKYVDDLKSIFDKTISDSFDKAMEVIADANNNINRLKLENETLRQENNSYKAILPRLKENANKSCDMIEALLQAKSKVEEDMGTEYAEDANDFESGKEDIEEEDEDLDDKSASKGEASAKRKKPSKDDSEEDIEEEDEDLDEESASKGEASTKRKKPSIFDSEEDIEEEGEDLDDESASKGEASAKRKKLSIFDSDDDNSDDNERPPKRLGETV